MLPSADSCRRLGARLAVPAAALALGAGVAVVPPALASSRTSGRSIKTISVISALSNAHARGHMSKGRFPVPTCAWVSTSTVARTLGVQVRGRKPVWSTQIAPVLTCAFVERRPNLQLGNVPIVVVQFRELQRFRPGKWQPVKGLGSCVEHSSCPAPGHAAYELVEQSLLPPSGSDTGTTTTPATTPTDTTTTPTDTATTPTDTTTTPTDTATTPTDTTTTPTDTTATPADPTSGLAGRPLVRAAALAHPETFVSAVGLRVEDGLNLLSITVANPNGPLPVSNEVAAVRKLARELLPLFHWK